MFLIRSGAPFSSTFFVTLNIDFDQVNLRNRPKEFVPSGGLYLDRAVWINPSIAKVLIVQPESRHSSFIGKSEGEDPSPPTKLRQVVTQQIQDARLCSIARRRIGYLLQEKRADIADIDADLEQHIVRRECA
jgi:hypothetical protein